MTFTEYFIRPPLSPAVLTMHPMRPPTVCATFVPDGGGVLRTINRGKFDRDCNATADVFLSTSLPDVPAASGMALNRPDVVRALIMALPHRRWISPSAARKSVSYPC